MDDDEKQEKRELRNWKRRMKYRTSGKFKGNSIQTFCSSDDEKPPVKKKKRSGVSWKKNVDRTINPEELRGQFETSSNYSEEAEILLAEMERQDDETNEKHKENPGTNNGCANCNKS